MQSLKDTLRQYAVEGELYSKLESGAVRCYACGHRCFIPPGRDGICRVRFNEGGRLMVPSGYVAGLNIDPTEKKPFFHVYPGSLALTFGMLGCDYHCGYCQNWLSSQALRDPKAAGGIAEADPDMLMEAARRNHARLVISSYNEPLITSEWAVSIFKKAKAAGFVCGYVSNGNATPEVLDYLRQWMDLYKIDLKSFQDSNYRKLGGVLQNVLDTIRNAYNRGFWVEVVTLVVPGFNDSPAEIKEMADFIAGISLDIPWHLTAFHKNYKMTGPDNTPIDTLIRCVETGRETGLHYVYAGNIPSDAGGFENTICHACGFTLIERRGFMVLRNRVENGICPKCEAIIPGRWDKG